MKESVSIIILVAKPKKQKTKELTLTLAPDEPAAGAATKPDVKTKYGIDKMEVCVILYRFQICLGFAPQINFYNTALNTIYASPLKVNVEELLKQGQVGLCCDNFPYSFAKLTQTVACNLILCRRKRVKRVKLMRPRAQCRIKWVI